MKQKLPRKGSRLYFEKFRRHVAAFISNTARVLPKGNIKVYSIYDEELDEDYHIAVGEKSIELDPYLIYVSFNFKRSRITRNSLCRRVCEEEDSRRYYCQTAFDRTWRAQEEVTKDLVRGAVDLRTR